MGRILGGEAIQRAILNRFRSDNRDRPGLQVEPGAICWPNVAATHVVGKVWRPADGSAVTRDHLQPAYRVARIDGLQQSPDQSPVMKERQPADDAAILAMIKCLLQHFEVVQNVRMADLDPFRGGQ